MVKYFIKTYGCQSNEADSERVEKRMNMLGHKKTENYASAKIIVLNACSVRQSAIDRVVSEIKKAKKSGKKIILAGCVLPKDKKTFEKEVDEIWHPDEYFDLIPPQKGENTAFVPIMTGCDNFCTYCAVPFTRGRERSRPAQKIISEVKKNISRGAKEIWLLGQNVNSYKSGKINFPKLLKNINNIQGDFWIRFISSHPKDFSDELIKTIAKCDRVVKYIHLPAQSGDNKILQKMNRGYTREHYKKLVKKIQKAIPNIKISTDVIVGFPGETKKQFQNTVKLFKEIGFDKAYVSRYSPRAGTAAAMTMKDNVFREEKKRRWQILDKLANNKKTEKKKIIVVIGPTASGKSDLAVDLAKIFDGEVISADSRQVYAGLDIGSGKITTKEMRNVKHHLLDVMDPKKIFTTENFKELAKKALEEIFKKEKIPIICGGTGFYIHALLSENQIPKVEPDWESRRKMEKQSAEDLFKKLLKLDKKRALTIDRKNKRRLIRAIEIAKKLGAVPDLWTPDAQRFEILWLGVKRPTSILKKRVEKRMKNMIRPKTGLGLIEETRHLIKHGVTQKRIAELGFEYIYPAQFLKGKITENEMLEKIITKNLQYAKRQMVWFKKYAPNTIWVKNTSDAKKHTTKFLEK